MNDKGSAAERLALSFLLGRGMRLLERNYSCRAGEIDLILADGDTVVFVEVRQRRNQRFGTAAETITAGKQRRILATAQHYLARRRAIPPCRFDAVLVDGDDRVEWIRGAFGA